MSFEKATAETGLSEKAGAVGRNFSRLRDFFPLTIAGSSFLALTLFGTWLLGAGESDLVVLVGGFTMLAFLAFTTILVGLGALLLKRELGGSVIDRTPLLLQVGCELPTQFRVRVPGWLPFLHFSWEWIGPRTPQVALRADGNTMEERARPFHRGEFSEVRRRFVVRDSLHLSEVAFTEVAPRPVQIFPSMGVGHQLTYLHNLVSGDEISHPKGEPAGDRVDMRQYTKGDSPRTILWKVFARSRKLMVKVPERALASQPRACCYLVTGSEDESAAGIGRDIIESDLLGEGWRFGVDGGGHTCNRDDSMMALMRSGDPALWGKPSDLPIFLSRAAQDGYGCCFVLVGADQPSERLRQVRQALGAGPLKTVLCLVIDGLAGSRISRFRAFFSLEPHHFTLHLEELENLWSFWSDGRVEVRLVDRAGGEVYRDVAGLLKALRSRSL